MWITWSTCLHISRKISRKCLWNKTDDIELISSLPFTQQIQLLVTLGFVCLMVLHDATRKFAHGHPELMIIPMVGTIVLICVIACCENARRSSPTNVILLGAFTLCESVLVGFISSTYKPNIVSLSERFDGTLWWLIFRLLGFACCWIDCGYRHRTDNLCLPNKMGFHGLWWSFMYRPHNLHAWKCDWFTVLPFGVWQFYDSLFRRRTLLALHRLWYTDDDG